MPILSPVPGFNFIVLLFDAEQSTIRDDSTFAAPPSGGFATEAGKTILFGSFREVNGLNAEIEIEEYHEGGKNASTLRFKKWGRYPNLVLRRGVTPNTDLWDWSYQVLYRDKDPTYKNGLILLNDRGGGTLGAGGAIAGRNLSTGRNIPGPDLTPIALWYFRYGLPEKLQGPNLDATRNEIAIETLEISHAGLLRVGRDLIPFLDDTLSRVGL